MKWYKTDLHLHTILSPCGDLEMSPKAVAEKMKRENIEIIAITDHNSVDNYPAYKKKMELYGIKAFCGCEIQSVEEIHIIAVFKSWKEGKAFGKVLYDSLMPIPNDPDFFGDQVVINENEEIIRFEEKALINSSIWSYEEIINKVNEYNGICFPAHVDAHSFSVIGQLGFIPNNEFISAVGVTAKCNVDELKKKLNKDYVIIKNSDAHYLKDIGKGYSYFLLEKPNFEELKMAIKNIKGRKIKVKI